MSDEVQTSLQFDATRPWPLGLPEVGQVLAAIVGRVEPASTLEAAHLRALTLFPEYLFDEARTSLGGAPSPAALATASAWRGVVAVEFLTESLGVDQPALHALIDELVEARERLVGAASFSLDGGEGTQELLSSVDECIGRLVVLARHQERTTPRAPPAPRPPPEPVAVPTRITKMESAPKRNVLRAVFISTVLLGAAFHLVRLAVEPPRAAPWVVVGELDSGRAYLAPSGPDVGAAGLAGTIRDLENSGVSVTHAANGEWLLARKASR